MSETAARAVTTTSKANNAANAGVLQRKCACGNHTSGTPTCSECNGKKARLQRKLMVGREDDAFEREADRVADQVTQGSAREHVGKTPPRVQRATAQEAGGGESAPASVAQVLEAGGSPLDVRTRRDMEDRFGRDFSAVRVHTDTSAAQSARDVSARAYTVGSHMVFANGEFAPRTRGGRHLIAHELTHVLQQSPDESAQVLRRTPTRGAGGCGPPTEIDEDNDGARAAGSAAHRQIQAFLAPAIRSEVEVPRATKQQRGPACQPAGTHEGYVDLMRVSGLLVEIGEIKPYPWAATYGVADAQHYITRSNQSIDRNLGAGAHCPGSPGDADDTRFSRTVRAPRRIAPNFGLMNGVLPNDTVIGPFDGDRTRTLKARQVAQGAVGYWCTGGQSDTFTCGASQQQIREYIDRVLVPSQELLDRVLVEQIERPLVRRLESMSIGQLLELGERQFGPSIRAELRPYLGPLGDVIINQTNAHDLGEFLDRQLGPAAISFVATMARRFVSRMMNELRTQLRNMLADIIRDTLATLCVGAAVVTLVQLMNALEEEMKRSARRLMPVVATAVATAMAIEIANAIRQIAAEIAGVVEKILAVVALVLLAIAIIVVGVIFVLSVIDPVPGDEVAVGAGEVALARLWMELLRFITASAPAAGVLRESFGMNDAGGEGSGTEPGAAVV